MGVGTSISVEEYLNTSYDPDVEYVDGVLVERNVGKWLHSLVQRNAILAFGRKYPDLFAVPELRVRVREGRYRIPDVSVLLAPPGSDILTEPPFVAIEIVSDTDSMSDALEKLQEYAEMGTANIWVFDPRRRQMFRFEANALVRVAAEAVATEIPGVELTREEVFRGTPQPY